MALMRRPNNLVGMPGHQAPGLVPGYSQSQLGQYGGGLLQRPPEMQHKVRPDATGLVQDPDKKEDDAKPTPTEKVQDRKENRRGGGDGGTPGGAPDGIGGDNDPATVGGTATTDSFADFAGAVSTGLGMMSGLGAMGTVAGLAANAVASNMMGTQMNSISMQSDTVSAAAGGGDGGPGSSPGPSGTTDAAEASHGPGTSPGSHGNMSDVHGGNQGQSGNPSGAPDADHASHGPGTSPGSHGNMSDVHGGNQGQSGGDADADGDKIVCTAMNAQYGFGAFRQNIWLKQSKSLPKEYQIGYHAIFRPLVRHAYKGHGASNLLLRKVLEHIAKHRTADIWAEMRGSKRNIIGRIERTILEPTCFFVGFIKNKFDK